MNGLAKNIELRAQEIRRLSQRIQETFKLRSRSAKDRDEWKNACSEFHLSYPKLFYPGGEERWVAFLALDPVEIETAIAFLETDPWFFRSGYLKQYVWRCLKRAELSQSQLHRLEAVAFNLLSIQVRREFWDMVRFFCIRGTSVFWETMASLKESDGLSVVIKANWFVLAKANYPVRSWVNREYLHAKYQDGYVPNFSFNPVGKQ